jgi:N-acyl-D-aspartate/D-glutamate deacylase
MTATPNALPAAGALAALAIRHALVYDGTGRPPVTADVIIKDGLVAALDTTGSLNLTGIAQFDATGLALAPGFIDVHTHSDGTILQCPAADSRVSQGITTEVVGNCGFSSACQENRRTHDDGSRETIWSDVRSYAAEVERRQPAVNIGTLCGHNTLRAMVVGHDPKPATPDQIRQMTTLLKNALDQGALGFSSGLAYIPGRFADTAEVQAIATALRGTTKPYCTHMRDENAFIVEAIDEASAIAAQGSGRLQISHLKVSGGPAHWHRFDEAVAAIDRARAAGVSVTADRYPYVFCETGLRQVMPAPYADIHDLQTLFREHPERRADAIGRLSQGLHPSWQTCDGWNSVILCNTGDPADRDFLGLSIAQIAVCRGMTPAEVCVDIIARTSASAAYETMSQANLDKFLQFPWLMPGSDGATTSFDYAVKRGHPRYFGTFPRFFRMARRYAPATEIIRRMTSLPADVFQLAGRGRVAVGSPADLVLFEEDTLDAGCDFAAPHTLASGIRQTFVNGALAFDHENPARRLRAGRFLFA